MKKRKKPQAKNVSAGRSGILNRISILFFSMPFAIASGLVFAVAIAAATFIEAKRGTGVARGLVYGAAWFEILLALIGVNLAANIFRHRMWRNGKEMVLLFHAAFLLILIGAGVTRHFGYEGTMRIREGGRTDAVLSNEAFLTVSMGSNGQRSHFEKALPISDAEGGGFDRTWNLNGKPLRLRLTQAMPGAEKKLAASESGKPGLELVIMDGMEADRRILFESDSTECRGIKFIFGAGNAAPPSGAVVRIRPEGGDAFLCSGSALESLEMMGRAGRTHRPGLVIPFVPRTVYTAGTVRFALGQFFPAARIVAAAGPEQPADQEEAGGNWTDGLVFEASVTGRSETVSVFGTAGKKGREEILSLDGVEVSIAYGSRELLLPFSLALNDFRVDRYPGSMKPSGFTSEVTLTDREEGIEKPVSIFMNHILRHRGYRFYQSSYDDDEKGTVLSVSRDPGMLPTYAGYLLLALGLIFNLLSPGSRFRSLGRNLRNAAVTSVLAACFFLSAAPLRASGIPGTNEELNARTSRLFGTLAVQDNQGRIKPVQSLAKEIIRSAGGLTARHPDPYRLGLWIFAFPEEAGNGGDFGKENPEKLFRMFPVKDDSTGRWVSAAEAAGRLTGEDRAFAAGWVPMFRSSVRSGDWAKADSLIGALEAFQVSRAGSIHPGFLRLKAETFYNSADVFGRLAPVLLFIGFALALAAVVRILRPKRIPGGVGAVLAALAMAAFLAMTAALALRWAVSGHAPWTNKYESMIFIAWSILLAGTIFGFRNRLTLAGSSILTGFLLSAAAMHWMDPRITTLPPVLKSIWLIIHVSVITSSYGFLALAAMLSLINLLFMIFMTKRASRFLEPVVGAQTASLERILTIGLTLLTIGNFLGAVWANESWGRYWGWDPKETWTLVTILIYSAVLHLRLVRRSGGKAVFNIASLFALGSVMMTYFGVNLYLSGMHSYASGARPGFPYTVFAVAGVFIVLSVIAWRREKSGHHR